MKGIMNTIELIFVLIALFIAFGVLLPGFSYRGKWSTAYLLLMSRDMITTVDRINKLYDYSFSTSLLNSFIENITPANKTNILWWSETEGTLKTDLYIGCNCTNETFRNLTKWFENLKINSRPINLIPCLTNLDEINLCGPSNSYPDVLLIWGYKDLGSYEGTLKKYLSKENGIIEVMDFDQVSSIQNTMFGITAGTDWGAEVDNDTILKPASASNIIYQPYKIFYHAPLPAEATKNGVLVGCTKNITGNLNIWHTNYTFSICDGTKVFFDTDANGTLDTGPLVKGSTFVLKKIINPIGFYTFTLNYVESDKIGVSFKPTYNFTDFCRVPTKKKIVPIDNNVEVFMQGSKAGSVAYCSILNGTVARTAWVADFSRDGLDKVGDDHVQMLISLILWASNKKSMSTTAPSTKTGFISTYINVFTDDMFEVYKLKLGSSYSY